MPAVTTADLFSIEVIDQLLVTPLFAQSRVLPYLRRIDTSATEVYLPVVSGGNAAWLNELEEFPDAAINADELLVKPKKVGALQTASHESTEDANAAVILGGALVDGLTKEVDKAFAVGAGPKGPTGLPGITGVSTALGDTKTLPPYASAISKVETAGGTPTVVFANPTDVAALQIVPATLGANTPALSGGAAAPLGRVVYGLPLVALPVLPAGTAWVVDGTRTVVVQRIPAEVAVSDELKFSSDGVAIRARMRLEFASVYPLTVCKISAT